MKHWLNKKNKANKESEHNVHVDNLILPAVWQIVCTAMRAIDLWWEINPHPIVP